MWDLYLDGEIYRAQVTAHYAFKLISDWCEGIGEFSSRNVYLDGCCVVLINEEPRWKLVKPSTSSARSS